MARILIIDDDSTFAEEIQSLLTDLGHPSVHAEDAEEALKLLAGGAPFDLILLDNKMPRMSGLEFLEERARRAWGMPVILMTSAHQDSTAIRATNLGAFGYVIKTVDLDPCFAELKKLIDEAIEVTRRPSHVPLSAQQASDPPEESLLVGRSRPMLDLLTRIGRVARLDETVLIRGETGTGKDLVARAIHTNSPRHAGPFVPLDCTALSEQLVESELFGHVPGAFTGAEKLRKGRFEHANGGTLFLDEAGELPLPLQAKLLRVLENREIVRVGSNDPIRINVRVLAATHRDLPVMVRDGKFRQDLFYRLEGISLHLPPLRERKEDVELLARTFLARMYAGGPRPALHPLTLEKLRSYDWPGNVRQLHKVVCRAANVCRGMQIFPEDVDFGELSTLPARPDTADPLSGLRALIEQSWQAGHPKLWDHLHDLLDRELLAYAQAQGVSDVKLAERLGKSRNYVRERLKQFGFKAGGD